MDCQHFEELAGAYALGALSEQERRAAEAHLATCARCRHILQELQEVTDMLPLAVPPVEPSPQLKTRLMAAVRADARQHVKQRIEQSTQKLPWWRYWQTRLALAFVLLLLIIATGLAAWNITLQQQLSALSTGQAIAYSVHGTSQVPGASAASGEAIYLPQYHLTILTVRGLPPLQGTEVYQGWLISNNQPTSIGLLTMRDGTAVLDFAGDVRGHDAIAISREPGPQASAAAPRGPVVAIGSLQNKQARIIAGEELSVMVEYRMRRAGS
ncbi:MAG: anti-sigma factor [Ktedonobacteraceae bacterium]|nr:anti-sigma factor [Ktedonobacteraceae bacterium]